MSNQAKYRQLTNLHRKLPLFLQPWWMDAACPNWDIVIVENKGHPEAVFSFQTEKKAGLKLMRNPPLCPYWGPFFLFQETDERKQWKKEEETLQQLWSQLPKWDYFQFTTHPGFQNFLPFSQNGFTNTNRLTYLLNLYQSEQELINNLQSRLRNYIRKAAQSLTIETGRPKDLSVFMAWHQRSFSKKGVPYPFSQSLIEKLLSAAESHDASLFQTAYDEEKRPVAMLWTPYDATTGYHLLAATAPDCTVNGALALLVRNAIFQLKQKGLAYYDFEGSMDKGIEQFFRKFGGERVPYLLFEQNKSLLWKIKRSVLG